MFFLCQMLPALLYAIRPRWQLVSLQVELEARQLIFCFPLFLSWQNSSGWWWAVKGPTHCFGFNFESFLTVLFFSVVLFVILPPKSTSSYLQHVCVFFFLLTYFLFKVPFQSGANPPFISSNDHLMPLHLLVSLWVPEMVGRNIPSNIFVCLFVFCASCISVGLFISFFEWMRW